MSFIMFKRNVNLILISITVIIGQVGTNLFVTFALSYILLSLFSYLFFCISTLMVIPFLFFETLRRYLFYQLCQTYIGAKL